MPSESAQEAAVVEDIEVIAVDSLAQAVAFFGGALDFDPTPSRLQQLFEEHSGYEEDYSDVRGQEMAKRAITIAAAGSHNLLMFGAITAPVTQNITVQLDDSSHGRYDCHTTMAQFRATLHQ